MSTTVKQTMTSSPVTARAKDDLSSAYIRMKREGFRHLPVIDDQGDLVGIISDRDFQRAMWPLDKSENYGLLDRPNFPRDAKVGQFMTWPVITLPEETSLLEAVQMIIQSKISAVAVFRDGQMTGIITHEDLLRVLEVLLGETSLTEDQVVYATLRSPISQIAGLLSTAGI